MTEELKQAAQQALEALGYGVAWKEGGHQKARAAIDALGAALTTSKPAQAGGVDAKCQTCNGHGLVGGHMQDGSGYGEGCPDCNPEPAPLVKWASTQPAAQATPEPVGGPNLMEMVNTLIASVNEAHHSNSQEWRDACFESADRVYEKIKEAVTSLYTRPAAAPDVEDLRDRLVAISAAVADSDDRAAQAMLGEILRALAAAQAKGGGNG